MQVDISIPVFFISLTQLKIFIMNLTFHREVEPKCANSTPMQVLLPEIQDFIEQKCKEYNCLIEPLYLTDSNYYFFFVFITEKETGIRHRIDCSLD